MYCKKSVHTWYVYSMLVTITDVYLSMRVCTSGSMQVKQPQKKSEIQHETVNEAEK